MTEVTNSNVLLLLLSHFCSYFPLQTLQFLFAVAQYFFLDILAIRQHCSWDFLIFTKNKWLFCFISGYQTIFKSVINPSLGWKVFRRIRAIAKESIGLM